MRSPLALLSLLLLGVTPTARAQYLDTALYSWHPSSDLNNSGQFDLGDVIHMVNYLYKGGPRPVPTPLVCDLDCSGSLNTKDLIQHVNWLFRGQWQFQCYDGGYLYRDSTGDTEADHLAMLLSGELRAPNSLKARVWSDLDLIRSRFGDSHPGTLAVAFVVPWNFGDLLLRPDSSTLASILAGNYTGWDSLNAEFQLQSYSTLYGLLWMRFGSTANVTVMCELYQQLPGMLYAYPDHWVGDWPSIWPQMAGDTIKYVFRYGWGDCLAGCAYSQYWFFKAVPGAAWPVGFRDEAGGDPAPAWWPEALAVWQNYRRL